MFEQTWRWSQAGDEWSAGWGGTEGLWGGVLLPRIHSFLPAETILEIAPGYGRWTHYLKDSCRRLILVDLSERCIEACRQRFSAHPHIRYHMNDGYSLEMVPDGSVDFAFSYDSLVHAEADVLESYVKQLAAKLKPDGVGFIHHSNLGAYATPLRLLNAVPSSRVQIFLGKTGLFPDITQWRAASMTAALFEQQCERAGLRCIAQELINFGGGAYLIDCLSLFVPKNSSRTRPNQVRKNRFFRRQAERMSKICRLYASGQPEPTSSAANA